MHVCETLEFAVPYVEECEGSEVVRGSVPLVTSVTSCVTDCYQCDQT